MVHDPSDQERFTAEIQQMRTGIKARRSLGLLRNIRLRNNSDPVKKMRRMWTNVRADTAVMYDARHSNYQCD